MGSRIVLGLSFLSVLAAAFLVWSAFGYFRTEFPDVTVLKSRYPVVQYQGPKTPPSVTLSKLRPGSWASLDEISKVAVGAILVSEDWAFYQHKGYDANQIKEAIKEDWEEGRFARGASTITQQVVRNVFLDKDKNLWRKIKELILAVRIEEAVSKRKILETYLNIAEWGEGIFGIRAASRHYFGKDPGLLTAREGAFLAMLLPSPKRYGQSFRAKKLTRYARSTISSILGKMTQANDLTPEERAVEAARPLPFEALADAEVLPPPPPEPVTDEGEGDDLALPSDDELPADAAL